MAEHVIKLPDVGEGVAEAELVEWHVKVGDLVREDAVLAAVMTDKATVEIPSPVDGEVVWLGAEIGDTVAVGAPLIRLSIAGEGASDAAKAESKDDAQRRRSCHRRRRARRRRAGKASRPPPAAKAKAQPEPAPDKPPAPARPRRRRHARRRRKAARLARRAAAGARGGRRPAPGFRQRPGRPHHP